MIRSKKIINFPASKSPNNTESVRLKSVRELHSKLSHSSFALRAFGALLKTSSLADFSDDSSFDAEEMRFGLSQIIDMYLLHQELLISDHIADDDKEDKEVIAHAEVGIEMIRKRVEGKIGLDKDGVLRDLSIIAKELNMLIRNGSDYSERAKKLKAKCRQLRKAMIL